MPFKPEQWPMLPTDPEFGSLIDPYGGGTVELYKREELVDVLELDNEICWNAYTSRKAASFALIQDGFRAVFHELGVGVRYDTEGNLKAIRVDVLTFLDELLEKYVDTNDEALDKLFGLSDILFECKKEFVAHLDLSSGQSLIYGINDQNGEKKILAVDKKDSFEAPAMLVVKLEDYAFCVSFQRFEDSFGVGVGVMEEDSEPSLIGSLPNSKEGNKFKISLLAISLANDCNYMTYLDNKNADRFDRLARRIILD